MNDLTHFDGQGRARMVNVSSKDDTQRIAVASGIIRMRGETLQRIRGGGMDKGDVLNVANVAAVMGAKKTHELIPMCHPLMLSGIDVVFSEFEDDPGIGVEVTVRCHGKTGVEMEALNAVSTALLTIYDMCKAIDRGMRITDIELLEKSGGKSGDWRRS